MQPPTQFHSQRELLHEIQGPQHLGRSNPTHTNAPLWMDANWARNFSHWVPIPELSSSY